MSKADKAINIILSLCNGIAGLFMLILLYSNLTRVMQGDAGLLNLLFPLYCILLFGFNIYSFWQTVHLAISVLQIMANLLLIPAFQIIFAIAIPIALGIAAQIGVLEDPQEIVKVTVILKAIIAFLLINCAYIIYRMVMSRKSQQTIKRAEA